MPSGFPADLAPSRTRVGWRLALAVAGASMLACAGDPYGAPVRVVIPGGASFRSAADSLARSGVITAPKMFRIYATLTGRDRALKAGTYLLRRGTSWPELTDALTKGRGIVRTVTIPEGFALPSIVPLLARTLGAPVDSVWAAVRDDSLREALGVPTPALEGYLFPDTYSFADGTTPRSAVVAMVRRFEQVWQPDWNEQLEALGMSRHEVVTLASIVEKEARLSEERPVIAAVYHNRLRARMRLQADPTVQYARGQHTERVLYRDLAIRSPYNTYQIDGLPPGPIASPGRASLEAALHPANVPYLFFVAHPDGHHEFHVTFDGHTRARQEIRRARGGR